MKNVLEEVFGKNYSKIGRIVHEGETYFKAKDACELIGIKNTSLAVNGNIRIGYFGVEKKDTLRVGSGRTATLYLTEAGLIMLILKSRKPTAYMIKTILSTEVIPEIMSTGSFRNDSEQARGAEGL